MHKDWFEDDNEIRLLHRGKRRLLDIVFGRTMVITLLLVLQIAIMVLGAHYLGRYYPALTIVLRVMSVAKRSLSRPLLPRADDRFATLIPRKTIVSAG